MVRSVFSLFPGAWLSQKEHFLSNSVSQHCSSLFGIGLEIWCESFHPPAHGCCCVASDSFRPFANTQLITHLLFQSCTELRGNYSAGDSSSQLRLASVCRSLCWRLPGTGMDGNIKQEGRNRHIRAAAVHWRHAELSQVHGPQLHKYGSITQSSLVSGLQTSLSRIYLQVNLHPLLDVDTVWYLHHLKRNVSQIDIILQVFQLACIDQGGIEMVKNDVLLWYSEH